MAWVIDNWSLIIVVLGVIIYFILNGKKSVMEWLLFAVSEAEREFSDSGMGKIKLKSVYDLFVVRYPIFSKILPFPLFAKWVDVVLVEMRKLIESNANFKKYINEFTEGEKS